MLLSKIKSKTLQDLLKVLSGNIVAQGIGFLTIIIISRDLGPVQYGIFSLLIAIFMIAVQISDFGISTSYVKYISENLSKAQEIFFTVIISKIVLSFIITTVLYLSSTYISVFFFETKYYSSIIKFISVSVLFHSLIAVVLSHYQGKQKFKEYAYIRIAHNSIKIITIIVIALLFSKEYHLNYFIYTYTFSLVLILFFLFLKKYRTISLKNKFKFDHFLQIYKLGFWIFLSSLLVIIMMRLDLFMLQKLSTLENVGFFSVVLTLNSIFILILSSISNTLLPKIQNYFKNNSVKDYVDKLFSFKIYILVFTIFMIVLSPIFVSIFFGEKYEQSILPFQILALSFFFSFYAAPLSLILINKNKAYLLSIMNLVQIIIIFFINLLLIPLFGLIGAAISLGMMRLFGFLFVYIYIRRHYL